MNNKQVRLWGSVTTQPDNNNDMNMMQPYRNSFCDDSSAFNYILLTFTVFNVDKVAVFYYIVGIFCLAH